MYKCAFASLALAVVIAVPVCFTRFAISFLSSPPLPPARFVVLVLMLSPWSFCSGPFPNLIVSQVSLSAMFRPGFGTNPKVRPPRFDRSVLPRCWASFHDAGATESGHASPDIRGQFAVDERPPAPELPCNS